MLGRDDMTGLLGEIKPTPRSSGLLSLLSDALNSANDYTQRKDQAMPGGLANPALAGIAGLLGLPALATTAERASYGEPLTNYGKSNVPLLRPETADAAMAAAPMLMGAARGVGKVMTNPALAQAVAAAASPKYASPAAMGRVGYGGQGGMLLYHGTNDAAPLRKIDPYGGTFNGLFASQRLKAASSHGDNLYRLTVPDEKVLRQDALNELGFDPALAAIKKSFPRIDDDTARMIFDGESAFSSSRTEDEILNSLRADSLGEADWELQRLRGQMAKNLGFHAVEMPDEHGTSYLITGGAKPRPANESAKDLFRQSK